MEKKTDQKTGSEKECTYCGGSGKKEVYVGGWSWNFCDPEYIKCPSCNGTGKIKKE